VLLNYVGKAVDITLEQVDVSMKKSGHSQQIDTLLRSMGLLKKQINSEVHMLEQGRAQGQDVNELCDLLRSEGSLLEQFIAKRRGNVDTDEADFDLSELVEFGRCYLCEEPVSATSWDPDPTKIRCMVCCDED